MNNGGGANGATYGGRKEWSSSWTGLTVGWLDIRNEAGGGGGGYCGATGAEATRSFVSLRAGAAIGGGGGACPGPLSP